jgi:hypothetical protein
MIMKNSDANKRDRAVETKDVAKEALRLIKGTLKKCDDKQARALLQRAADDISTALKAIRLPPKKREPKQAPYVGGGSWCTTMSRRQPKFSGESW